MSLKVIQTHDEHLCAETLAVTISRLVLQKKKVLWLVPGGSNIKIAVTALNLLLEKVDEENMPMITMALTDERYGPVGHKDSNWQQLIDSGFAFSKIKAVPILTGLPLEETVKNYGEEVTNLFAAANHVVAQFGIGADGHIGGVLPHTVGVDSKATVIGYESAPFVRISLSLSMMKKINSAYAFVFGESKKDALQKLLQDGSLDDIPCRVLKLIPEAYLYTDQNL